MTVDCDARMRVCSCNVFRIFDSASSSPTSGLVSTRVSCSNIMLKSGESNRICRENIICDILNI